MFSTSLFILSGLVIVTMLLAKRMEEKRKTGVFLLKLISKGDEQTREFYNHALHQYSISKEKTYFLVRKQLPLRAKNWLNKSISWTQETLKKYMGDIRNSHLLKRPDGISEFFKSISEVEKGNGEINEPYIEKVETSAKKVRTPRKRKITVFEAE